jgi:hypothetical protein
MERRTPILTIQADARGVYEVAVQTPADDVTSAPELLTLAIRPALAIIDAAIARTILQAGGSR